MTAEITEIFPGMDPVFHPEDLNVLFEKLGVGSVDEIVAKFPRRAFVRHETWVVPGRNEDEVSVDTDTCPEVASTKKAVKATLPKS